MPSFSEVENFSCTYQLSRKLSEWNDKNTLIGFLGSRAVGVIATPFTCIIDLIAHTALAPITVATGVFVSPYNLVAKTFSLKHVAPEELQISAAFVHLRLVVWILVDIFTLPCIILLDPNSARDVLEQRQIKGNESDERIAALEKKVEASQDLEKQNQELQTQLEAKTQENQETAAKLQQIQQEKEALEKQKKEWEDAKRQNESLRDQITLLKNPTPVAI